MYITLSPQMALEITRDSFADLSVDLRKERAKHFVDKMQPFHKNPRQKNIFKYSLLLNKMQSDFPFGYLCAITIDQQ